ncbi:MAG: hypothetical protein LBJ23_03335, partial [Tannerella sp.]|nr:hypothetical protein [Tannerella sp.]
NLLLAALTVTTGCTERESSIISKYLDKEEIVADTSINTPVPEKTVETVDSCLVEDHELKFFYNGDNNYLLFKPSEQ